VKRDRPTQRTHPVHGYRSHEQMSGGGGGGGDSAPKYNQRSPAVRRILKEAKELQDDPSDEFVARFLDVCLFLFLFLYLVLLSGGRLRLC